MRFERAYVSTALLYSDLSALDGCNHKVLLDEWDFINVLWLPLQWCDCLPQSGTKGILKSVARMSEISFCI